MLEIGLAVIVILVCLIALGSCIVSGRSDDRVNEVLKQYHKKQKQNENS